MARLPYVESPETSGVLNLFRMLAHSPPVLEGVQRLGAAVLTESSLDPRLREVAILRSGMLAGADYEVNKHLAIARWVGLTDAEIAGLRPGGDAASLEPPARAILTLCDELHAGARATDEAFRELRRHLTDRQVVEVVVTVGFYGMICRVLETLAIDQESADPITP
jgi:4-carboxymuconolactone decarboxylase